MKLPCSVLTKDFEKMASENSFSPHKKVIGTLLSLLFVLVFSIPLLAQVNASKGVPSYTNYVIGDVNLAGQQA